MPTRTNLMCKLEYPTHNNPTSRLQLNPIFLPNGVQYRYQAMQQSLVAVGGREYIMELAPVTVVLLEMELRDLPREDQGELEGWETLYGFLRNTLRWGIYTCSLTDPDGQLTNNVRLVTTDIAIHEMAGDIRRAGHFSGLLTFRQSIT